jgi:hypothetical protein
MAKQDWTIGAIYRLGRARKFDRPSLVALLTKRAKLPEMKSRQLAGHWLASAMYAA